MALAWMIYALLAVAYFGWGKTAADLLGLGGPGTRFVTFHVWIGWALTLFIFQLIHFVLPITALVVIPVLAIGVAAAAPGIVKAARGRSASPPRSPPILPLSIGAGLLAVSGWLASRSMLPPEIYDSGLYHFNKIRWINSFPMVPGLGNLHGRLAFNQSFFTYVAALNFHPLFGHGRSIANSFMLLLTMATFIDLSRPAIERPPHGAEAHPFQFASIVILSPVLVYLAFSSPGLTSPSPDLTSTLLQLTMFLVLAQGVGNWTRGQTDQDDRALLLGILATSALTVKLSNLAFCATVLAFVLFYARRARSRRVVLRTVLLCAMVTAVWCLQSIILSGAPLYPSTIGYVRADWSVPRESIVDEANRIFSWARQPSAHWSTVLGNSNWFEPWLHRVSTDVVNVVFPLATSVILSMMTAATWRLKIGKRPSFLEWSIVLPALVGLAYWFFSAPDPRFAAGMFFILSACSTLLLFSSLHSMIGRRTYVVCMCVVFVVANVHFWAYLVKHGRAITSISVSGWHPVKPIALDQKVTVSGLSVYTPTTGDQCWDSPLPSTPHFKPQLRLRNPRSLSSGFTVEPEPEQIPP